MLRSERDEEIRKNQRGHISENTMRRDSLYIIHVTISEIRRHDTISERSTDATIHTVQLSDRRDSIRSREPQRAAYWSGRQERPERGVPKPLEMGMHGEHHIFNNIYDKLEGDIKIVRADRRGYQPCREVHRMEHSDTATRLSAVCGRRDNDWGNKDTAVAEQRGHSNDDRRNNHTGHMGLSGRRGDMARIHNIHNDARGIADWGTAQNDCD